MRRLGFFLAALAAPALAASPEVEGLKALAAQDARVAAIGYRLATRNAALCPATAAPQAGFAVHHIAQYAPALRRNVAIEFPLGPGPQVLAVVPGSAAARSGLVAGDSILEIDGVPVPRDPPPGKASYAPVEAFETMFEQAMADGEARIRIGRDGIERALTLRGERGCASRVQIVPGNRLNAWADGRYVQLTTAIVAFAGDDEALATVIAHEMAHNILGHSARLKAQKVPDGLLQSFGKNAGRVRATEIEADRLGIYLMANAGYDVSAAPRFWKRYGDKTGLGIFSDRTHPRTGERVRLAQAAVAEVRAKRASGAALTP